MIALMKSIMMEPTDLVAINVETFTARRAYEIAAEYRARRVPVVMGGMHATARSGEVAEHADAVYTGDGESLWTQLVADAHAGMLASALSRRLRGASNWD